tara:strand:+ start:193 stop:1071 length:879 start_codon:yes stop_codon:yes gene_type:complete
MKYIYSLFFFLSCAKTVAPDQDMSDQNQSIFGSSTSLDIVTWNIEQFPKNNNTINYLIPLIDSIQPDLIALQEINDQYQFTNFINNLDNNWVGYKSNKSSLAFLINTNNIEILNDTPYTILDQNQYFFAYREPYVVDIRYNNIDYTIINVHYKCCGDGVIGLNESDEEYRRVISNELLENYISTNLQYTNLVVLGDFNDDITDTYSNNVFKSFLDEPDIYKFSDITIANESSNHWSYPSWPSHLDHILITSQLFNDSTITQTILVEKLFERGWIDYDQYISDHRPVGIKIID